MAGVMVGGAFLSATLQVLFDRMACRSFMDFIRRQRLSDAQLKKLKITLLAVNAVLNDAEEKQITNPEVKAWLDELKEATYDAEDLLDEIATEASRCKLEAESHTSTDQVWNFISASLNPFDEGIKSKLGEILGRLEYIAKQINFLGLKEGVGGKSSEKLPTTSLIEESGIYGRDDDKEEIIKLLLSDDASRNEISVITIVGMGGVGKTTVAQLVFNDRRVMDHFDIKAWVCVSEEFDVLRVTKTILEAVTSSACDIKDLNQLQVRLKERLTGQKFLLILDDVWNENYNDWDALQSPFRSTSKGSKIIITTRNESVASIMRTVPSHHLKQLLDEDCWLLFAKYAFYNGNSSAHPDQEVIGREIAKRCKGLPLAAKTLGGLLRSKLDVKEWDKILESNIWDLSNDKSNILPALRLSYHYLPSHLKRCFAYCSIFPKDYKFEKEQLVLLWMAEDFLQQPKRNKRMEDLGDEYFHDLVSRSLFQRSSGNESHFVMHDLVNDLAKFVSGEFCVRLESDKSQETLEKTRHLSYSRTEYDAFKKFEAFNDAKCLRTFLPFTTFLLGIAGAYLTNKVPQDLLPTLSCLRVLSLSHYYNIELPESISSLKHLRYLDLSHTKIKSLPNSTSSLYNLQTLMLSNCRSLSELPASTGQLINLRHLDVSWTKLKEMPRYMSRLRSLQTLSTFIVSKHNGSTITELSEFWHLRGSLHILELQNVVHVMDALEANLKAKKYLDELVLEWSTHTRDSQNEREVLDMLQPHANLKKLTIKYYGGTRFSDWLGDHSFCNMVYLCLSNCKYCFSLPPLGQLPCLKNLSIVGFDEVERVGPEFYGNDCFVIKPFGSLEVLRFEKMLHWMKWFCCLGDEGGDFPRLRELYIQKCPKLIGCLPSHLPSLTKLVIFECEKLVASLPSARAIRELQLFNCDKVLLKSNDEPDDQMITLQSNSVGLQDFSYLEELRISDMSKLKELPPWLQRPTIKRLKISNCPSLESFPRGGLPITLKTLYIWNCRRLELLQPEAEETTHNFYPFLESLSIYGSCDLLKSFPLGLFPKLNRLGISECLNLQSFWIPEGLHEDLTSLTNLNICGCPKLVSFPKGGLPTPNLLELKVCNCNNLESLPERMHALLPSLQHLYIEGCAELESFPEGGLPSNLRALSVCDCEKLTANRMNWGLQRLPSLKYFTLEVCEDAESLPEKWLLPSTLTSLEIRICPNLKYLDQRGLQHLTSLEKLYFRNCPQLQCLPEQGLPASLSFLRIRGCPLLIQRCQREKGQDWPKIARIPRILIDEKLIS